MRTVILLLIWTIAISSPCVGTESEPLTLEAIFASDLFTSPNPTWIQWLPDGSGLLYRLADEDGRDMLWLEGLDGERTAICNWSDLQEELATQRPDWRSPAVGDVNTASSAGSAPAIAPDSRTLVAAAAGELFRLDLDSGAATLLTNAPHQELYPTFDPSGTRVAFVRHHDLYWVDLKDGSEHRLTTDGADGTVLNGVPPWVYEEELGTRRSFWWSPDGGRIAFLRYDVSDVGLFPVNDQIPLYAAATEQRYPKAGTENPSVQLRVLSLSDHTSWEFQPLGEDDGYVPRAGWTPDGSQLWYQRLNRAQNRLELQTVCLGSGEVTTLLVEAEHTWVNLHDDLFWLDNQRFLWTSERDGWRHLYLYDRNGLIRQLTSGEWEIDHLAGVLDGRALLVTTRHDPRERHVDAVPLLGGPIEQLSDGEGTWSIDLSPSGDHWLGTYSDLTTPPRITLWSAGGDQERVVFDGRIPAVEDLDLQPPELGTVTADDGTELFSATLRPQNRVEGHRYPVVHYVYGGPHVQLVRRAWGGSRYLFYQFLAERGLIVFWLDNRGSAGRGKAFESAIHRRLGQLEVADQLAGLRHLHSLPFVDPGRVAAYGGSYGGYLTLMLLLTSPDSYRAGVAYAPVTDWRLYDSAYTERYMGLPDENPDGYTRAAPLTYADRLTSRLLVVHGAIDNNVHLQNTLRLVEAFAEEAIQFELMIYPRVRHGVRVSRFKHHFHQLKTDFLLRNLTADEVP